MSQKVSRKELIIRSTIVGLGAILMFIVSPIILVTTESPGRGGKSFFVALGCLFLPINTFWDFRVFALVGYALICAGAIYSSVTHLSERELRTPSSFEK